MKKTLLGLVTLFGLSTFALPAFAEGAPVGNAPVVGDSAKPAPKVKKVKKIKGKKVTEGRNSSTAKGRRHDHRHGGRK